EDKFKQLSEADDVLSDPKKREVYDKFGAYNDNIRDAARGPAGAGFDFDWSAFTGEAGAGSSGAGAGGGRLRRAFRGVVGRRAEGRGDRRNLNRGAAVTSKSRSRSASRRR